MLQNCLGNTFLPTSKKVHDKHKTRGVKANSECQSRIAVELDAVERPHLY